MQVFNVTANDWELLPEAYLQPMLTNDSQGIYRQDNHAWLFGWSNGTLFQARDRMWARPMSLGL
jgi:galactose oxidase